MLWTSGEILNKQIIFRVPFYQRGYRWGEKQVVDLLNDLYQFYTKMDEENLSYYSLQPLVLKPISNDREYILVDGQQRLTTLLIILYVFEEYSGVRPKDKYSIIFDRPKSEEFLRNILKITKDEAKENADFWYMFNAREFIQNWIKANNLTPDDISDFMNFIRRGKKIYRDKDVNKNIRFIKYILNEGDDEFEVFTRLNIGKIKLTNAELIKSYILYEVRQSLQDFYKDNKISTEELNKRIEKERFVISQEWDEIEYTLQDNEFFSFLTNNPEKYKNRIELIFQIYLNLEEYKDYELYENFVSLVETEHKKIKDIWLEIKRIYRMLYYWNKSENIEYYHLIGFLTSQRYKDNKINIIEIYDIYRNSLNQEDFVNKLKKLIIDKFKRFLEFANEFELKKNNLNDYDLYELFENYGLIYGNSKQKQFLEDILLLFNIASVNANNSNNENRKLAYTKFSFYHYNNDSWSLEHINPKIEKIQEREINNIYQKLTDLGIVIENSIDLKSIQDKFTDSFFISQENKDLLFNLTLLPRNINSALKNNFFVVKRQLIIEYDKFGAFIPLCTKNVFLKYYTPILKAEDLNKWTKEDAINYIENLIGIIKKFLNNG